jgi:putative hemolysin
LDDDALSSVLVLLLLILLKAIIVLAYTALTNIRQPIFKEQAEAGNPKAKRVLSLNENFTRLTITYQLSMLLIHVAIAAIVTLDVAEPFVIANAGTAPALIYAAVLVVTIIVVLLLGDILPESLGSAYADSLAPLGAYPIALLMLVLKPVISVMTALGKLFAQMFGSKDMAAAVTEEEIMTLVDAGQKEGTIEHEEKEMIFSVLQFGELLAYEIMIPRMDVVALDIDTPFEEALAKFIETGHSRIPVYKDNIDNIEGLLYAKDLLTLWHNGTPKPKSIRDLMRKAHFVPESKRADLLLQDMQASKVHMAIVVDEYGGTAGLLTIEDLIEEIVGDIQDEYDLHEEAEYSQQGPGEYMIDGGMNLSDVNELLKIELPTEDSSTLGGYIYSKLGRVPTVGEVLDDDEHALMMRIDSVDGRRIRKVHVMLKPEPEEKSPEEDSQPEEVSDKV